MLPNYRLDESFAKSQRSTSFIRLKAYYCETYIFASLPKLPLLHTITLFIQQLFKINDKPKERRLLITLQCKRAFINCSTCSQEDYFYLYQRQLVEWRRNGVVCSLCMQQHGLIYRLCYRCYLYSIYGNIAVGVSTFTPNRKNVNL